MIPAPETGRKPYQTPVRPGERASAAHRHLPPPSTQSRVRGRPGLRRQPRIAGPLFVPVESADERSQAAQEDRLLDGHAHQFPCRGRSPRRQCHGSASSRTQSASPVVVPWPRTSVNGWLARLMSVMYRIPHLVRSALVQQKSEVCAAPRSLMFTIMSRESRIKLLPSRTITPGKDQTGSRSGRSIRMMGWEPGPARGSPGYLPGTRKSLIGNGPSSAISIVPLVSLRARRERGSVLAHAIRRHGGPGSRGHRPVWKQEPTPIQAGISSTSLGCRRPQRAPAGQRQRLDRVGSRPLHWLHCHWRDREGRLLPRGDWSTNRRRNLIGHRVRGLAPVAIRMIRSDPRTGRPWWDRSDEAVDHDHHEDERRSDGNANSDPG